MEILARRDGGVIMGVEGESHDSRCMVSSSESRDGDGWMHGGPHFHLHPHLKIQFKIIYIYWMGSIDIFFCINVCEVNFVFVYSK